MADQNNNQSINTTGSRRLKYGSNLLLMLIIVIVIVGLLGFLTTKYHHPSDWSTGGLFTLSGQTQKLLEEIDNKKQPYEIVNNVTASRDPSISEVTQEQQVRDMLDLYTRQSGYIKLWTPSTEELDAKIRERFKDEIKPYELAIKNFDPLVVDLNKFFQEQSAGFIELSQAKDLSPDDARGIQGIAGTLGKSIPKKLVQTQHDVREYIEATAPVWTKAKTEIAQTLGDISEGLKQFTGPNTDGGSKFILDYLKKNAANYAKTIKQLDDYKTSLEILPPLKIDEIRDSIGPNTLIVFGPNNVKIIGAADIFQPDTKNAADPAHPKMLFQGEQAVSTALMAMARPNKSKVVFITTAPAQLLTGPFSEINDRLTKANFDVSEWSPPGPPNPEQPQPSPNPPATGKDASGQPVVWVVMPPEPPNMQQMQMGMPPPDPRPVVEMVKKHMDAGGSVLFLVEGSSPMSMMTGGGYPYSDLIKPFGIQIKDTYSVLRTARVSEDATRAIPEINMTAFPEHQITDPLQSLRTLFLGTFTQQGLMGAPTVVDVAKPAPSGTDPAVIVQTPTSAEIFATTNTMSANPVYDPKTDLKAPIPLGAASTLTSGNSTQRVVVLGNKFFLVNQILQQPLGIDQNGNMIYAFPGNAELMINCVSWLSGYGNMIAVSPQANVAQRIANMSPTQAMMVRLGSFIVPPLLAIVIGTIIFFVRRRA